MRIETENLVSISEANQNFSRVARLVDASGVAVILKNNVPRYVILPYDQVAEASSKKDEDAALAGGRIVQALKPEIGRLTEKGGSPLLYCETCHQLFDPRGPETCDACGGGLRPPLPNDPILLLQIGSLKADMIAPLLDDLGIPYVREGKHGVGFTMRAGSMLEAYRFIVPYGAYARSREVLEETFGEDQEMMEALR